MVRQELTDHKHEQRIWVRNMLGLAEDPDHSRYIWTPAKATDPDVQAMLRARSPILGLVVPVGPPASDARGRAQRPNRA